MSPPTKKSTVRLWVYMSDTLSTYIRLIMPIFVFNFQTWPSTMSAKRRKDDLPLWKRKLYQRVCILSWLEDYNADSAISDLIAGITVGLTVMPQSLAYATLAGLEPQVSTAMRIKLSLYDCAAAAVKWGEKEYACRCQSLYPISYSSIVILEQEMAREMKM